MSKTTLTEGDWYVNPQTPCTVMTPDGRISVCWRSNDGSHDAKAEVAARLIAAAPQMYEALDDAERALANDGEGLNTEQTIALNTIRAALDAATGDSDE